MHFPLLKRSLEQSIFVYRYACHQSYIYVKSKYPVCQNPVQFRCRVNFFLETAESASSPSRRVRAIPSRARAGRVSRRILARGRTYRHPRSAGAARRARTARETTPVLFGGGDGVSVTLNRAFDAGQRTKRTPIFGAAMSGPETPARVKKETAKVRSRVRRGEHMTETISCHGREVSPRRTPAPGSLAIAERFHDGFGTPETPVRVVTLAPRPGSSRRPKRDAADR